MTALEPGTRVRFTRGSIGMVSRFDQTKFEPEVLHAGDEGRYLQPHPNPRLDGWHLIEVVANGRTLYAPVTDDYFEVVS